MKNAKIRCIMGDGSVLYTPGEVATYAKNHEFPPYVISAIRSICDSGSKAAK